MQQRRKKYSLSDLIQHQSGLHYGGLQSGGLSSGGKYTWNDFKNTMGRVGKVAMKIAPGALTMAGQPELALLATGANALTGRGLLIGGCNPYCGGARAYVKLADRTQEQRDAHYALLKFKKESGANARTNTNKRNLRTFNSGNYDMAHRDSAFQNLQNLELGNKRTLNFRGTPKNIKDQLKLLVAEEDRMLSRYENRKLMPHYAIDEYNYSLYPKKVLVKDLTPAEKKEYNTLNKEGRAEFLSGNRKVSDSFKKEKKAKKVKAVVTKLIKVAKEVAIDEIPEVRTNGDLEAREEVATEVFIDLVKNNQELNTQQKEEVLDNVQSNSDADMYNGMFGIAGNGLLIGGAPPTRRRRNFTGIDAYNLGSRSRCSKGFSRDTSCVRR